jgi:hypothetical protein
MPPVLARFQNRGHVISLGTRRGAGHYLKSRPDMQYVTIGHGSRITAVMRAARSPEAMATLTPEGRALFSPVITVDKPGKPPAHYDSATTVISVSDAES